MADQRDWRDASMLPSREGAPDDTTWALGFTDAAAPAMFPDAGTPPSAAAPSQIVFIEGSVADYQILAAGVQPGVKVVILNPDANGVQQIADYLQQHDIQNLSAISIVTDGADGEIQLGNTLLSASNIADYQQQLAAIGAALQPGGDLLLYGCDVAQNSAGDAFLGDLATATGVGNIAAASHVVGSAAEGGSFNLDVDLGNAAATTGPFTAAAVAAYPDLLGITSNLVWYITTSSTTSQTGVYTVDGNGSSAATNPDDISSSPAAPYVTLDGLAIDPSAGVYFVANILPSGPFESTNQILEGNISGGTPSVIYTSANSGGDAIVGLDFDQLNGLLYMAVTDVNFANSPPTTTDTGIYTISALGSGTRTATELVFLSSGTQAPNDIAIDTTHNLLFYTNGVPGLTNVEEVGVANLTTGAIINSDLVSYSASGNVEPYGIAVNPATDTLYWTTVNFAANSGNAIYSATYSTGASVTLSGTQTLATTSQAQVPYGISLDVPAGGYYVDTTDGIQNDTTDTEVLFGSSLTSPATLTDVYNVPGQDGGTETLITEGIVVEVQPVVAASGTVSYVQGGSAIALDSGATVADADGYYLASATVTIASELSTGDTLNFTNQNGITGSFSSGTLTLTGTASAANYQTALDSVTFSTTNDTNGTARTIDWTVSDGVVSSATETSTVHVHVAPVVNAGTTVTFDGGGGAVKLDSGLTVSDASSSTLVGAAVLIVDATSTDRLNFTNQNGITGSYSTTTDTLALSGTATVAEYQAALDSITYSVLPTDSDPTDGGSDTSRTIDWSVNDGVISSSIVTSTVHTVHEPPTVSAGATATFDGGGSPVTLDSGVTAADGDSGGDLIGATVVIGGYVNGDTLTVGTSGGLGVSFSDGVLTLSGTASIATYNTALDSVDYGFTAGGDPTGGGSHTSRTISWSVNDGVAASASATSGLDVEHEAPTIAAAGTVTFHGGGSPVTLDSGVTASDADSGGDLASATVVIGGYIAGDTLTVGTAGGLGVAFSNGTLTLTGTAGIATYNTALDSVEYGFTAGHDPTGGGSDTTRTISWSVNDGVVSSATGSSTLDVVHTAPTITAGGTATFDGGGGAVALDPGLTVTDVDSGNVLSSATVTIAGAITGDTLNFTNSHPSTEGNIAVSSDSNGVLVLTSAGSTATVLQWETALESVQYSFTPSDGDPTGGGSDTSRTIHWVVSDGSTSNGISNTSTSTLDTVHEPPTITAGGTVDFDGGGAAVALDPGLTVADPDSSNLVSATVIVGGFIVGDTLSVGTAGGLGTIFSDGTLTLSGTASVATYQAALDSVDYTFTPTDGDPTGGGGDTSRAISWSVNDGVASAIGGSTLDTVHEPPTVTAGGTVDFTGGSGAEVALDSGLALTDPDSDGNIVSATVTVGGFIAGDTLSVGTAGGLTTSFSDGTLTLSGTAAIGTYQAALDSVDYTFTPTDGDPTGGGGDTSRAISWSVNDGVATGSGGSTLDVIHVAPTVVAGGSATYPENAAPVALDPGLTASDPDSGGNLIDATVSISDGFLTGDALDFTNQDGITGGYDAATGVLTLTGTASIGDYEAALQSVAYSFSGDPTAGGTDDGRTITWTVGDGAASSAPETSSLTVLCFCKGTRIATPDGQVAVEQLAVGDRVLTASNAVREITWIGEGNVLATRGRRNAATPVIVSKHAIARNVPDRDLRITKAHGLFFDGVLIPVEFLVNHRSIRWDDRAQEVRLYHIELETHDVLLANGVPAESYRDDGNRWLFRNANSGWHLPPKPACVPVLTGGDIVDAVWRRLLDRSGPRHMPPLTDEPDLHLLVDGRRVDAVEQRDLAYVFRLTQRPASVRIVSRDAVPAELGLVRDPRSLGVALRRIVLCQGTNFTFIEAADPRLVQGYHAFERATGVPGEALTGIRWTTGDAVLPADAFAGFTGPFEIVLHLGGRTQYIADEAARRAA